MLFLERVEVDDLLGHFALLHLHVRSLDDAEIIDARVSRETEDETDVLAFWRVDRAKASVVRRVHVAHFEACALAGKAAGAERRERAEVLKLAKGCSAGP